MSADRIDSNSLDGEQVPFLEEAKQDQVPDATATPRDSPATIFFKASDLDIDSTATQSRRRRFSTPAKRYSYTWAANGVFFLLNICIFTTFLALNAYRPCSNVPVLLWSPAQDAIEWETRIIDAIPGSTPYTGSPNSKSDAAWTELLKGINIKIFPDEMERLGYTSLQLKDGSGYVGSLGVYHELHCLKRVRKMIYRDYYYPNMSTDEWHHRMGHLEHCLEQIRQSSICHGDVNIIPFTWLRDEERDTASPTMQFGSLHQCVNWDKLDKWAKARRLDLFDQDLLLPPS